jgi:hypothetical protein
MKGFPFLYAQYQQQELALQVLEQLKHVYNRSSDNRLFDNPQTPIIRSLKLIAFNGNGPKYMMVQKPAVLFGNKALTNGELSRIYAPLKSGPLMKKKKKKKNKNKIQSYHEKKYFSLWRKMLKETKPLKDEDKQFMPIIEALSNSDKLTFITRFFSIGELRINGEQATLPVPIINRVADIIIRHNKKLAFMLGNVSPLVQWDKAYKGRIIILDNPSKARNIFTEYSSKTVWMGDDGEPCGFFRFLEPHIIGKKEAFYTLETVQAAKPLPRMDNPYEAERLEYYVNNDGALCSRVIKG